MKVGEFIDKPADMSIESIDEKKQTAICVWIDVKSGKTCRCEIPLSALEHSTTKEN
jgi:hypothetical protein